MFKVSVCIYLLVIYGYVCFGEHPPDAVSPEHPLVEIPEAISPDDLDRAKQSQRNEKVIHASIEHQAALMDSINKEFAGIAGHSNNDAEDHPYFHWDSEEPVMYSESHLDDLEAPVIYLTPPVVLPDEQMEADKELEDILIDTGLEQRPKAVDPFQITDTDAANTAIKVSKTNIDNLRHKRSTLMRTMRETATLISTDHSKHALYRSQAQELKEVEKQLDEELVHLLKLEHVKKSLSKQHGAGHDTEMAEEELEDRESELAKAGNDDDDEEGLEEDDEDRSNSDEL